MHPLRPLLCALLLLPACSSSDGGTTHDQDTGTTVHATDGHASHTSGSSGAATESTGPAGAADDTSTGGTTHDTHDTHDPHDTHDTHATSDAPTTGGEAFTPVDVYCGCMLENCHDQYHALWGEDHLESEAMCKAAAEAVPSVGAPASSGDSIECRIHHCELGHDDPAACDSALGAAPCM